MNAASWRKRIAVLLLGAAASFPGFAAPPASQIALAALITEPELAEISGIASSHRRSDLLWVHNDSGGLPVLYAIDTSGTLKARLTISDAVNVDWEDLSSFDLDGKPYLLVADTGDNGGRRSELQLYVIEEAAVPHAAEPVDLQGKAAWTIRIRWPDGPHDCEGVAVDPLHREVLLMSKRRVPAQLFRVALDAPKDDLPRVAEQIALINNIPQPTPEQAADRHGMDRFRAQITGLDLSVDGRWLAVLTYHDGYVYEHRRNESWQTSFARPARHLGLPPIPQAEAIAFSPDGKLLWVSSERLPAPLIRVEFTAP